MPTYDPWALDASVNVPAYTGQELRLGTVSPVFAGSTNPLGVRSGVKGTAAQTDLLVQAQSTPNMTVKVNPGMAVIQGSSTSAQGAYSYALADVTTLTIAASHVSLVRKDLIVARVRDALVIGNDRDGPPPVVIAGTPGGGTPALPADGSYVTLAEVNVGAGVSSITSGNVADRRPFAAALGGSIPWIGTAPTSMPPGQLNADITVPTATVPYHFNGTTNLRLADATNAVTHIYSKRRVSGNFAAVTGATAVTQFSKGVALAVSTAYRVTVNARVISTVTNDTALVSLYANGDLQATTPLALPDNDYCGLAVIDTTYVTGPAQTSATFAVLLQRGNAAASSMTMFAQTGYPFEFTVLRLGTNTALVEA
ncbi:MAG TPA: hypothetical protein VK453_25420 [Micromonosporaceae bacterium]|nr:hypothetical protein [Micromonosporaceae bacterium]